MRNVFHDPAHPTLSISTNTQRNNHAIISENKTHFLTQTSLKSIFKRNSLTPFDFKLMSELYKKKKMLAKLLQSQSCPPTNTTKNQTFNKMLCCHLRDKFIHYSVLIQPFETIIQNISRTHINSTSSTSL